MSTENIKLAMVGFPDIKSASFTWFSEPGTPIAVTKRGFEGDRQYVVVDGKEHNMFVAQRSGAPPPLETLADLTAPLLRPFGLGIGIKRVCQIKTRVEQGELILSAPGMNEVSAPAEGVLGEEEPVQVWLDSTLMAIDQGGGGVNEWLCRFLGQERPGQYRLMRMADSCKRRSKSGKSLMGFHDGYPFMWLSEESLANLNALLNAKGEPSMPMNRFRPSMVFAGGEDAHFEDHLSRIRIGDVVFEGATLCSRCPVIQTDQDTAKRGNEPSKTLLTYRSGEHLGITGKERKIFFGRNADHMSEGVIHIGDRVEVLTLD